MNEQLPGFDDVCESPSVSRPKMSAPAKKEAATLLALQDQMMKRGRELGDIGYTTPLWAQFALPHRNPGEVPFWSSSNRGLDMVITPGTRLDENGKRVTAGYPWGRVPRAMLTYMATQAVLTDSPHIQLGEGRNDFFRKVGITRGNPARQRQTFELVESLAAANVKLEESKKGSGASWGYRWRRLTFVDGLQLWMNDEKNSGAPLWGSTVRLSDEFFETIVNAPMPLLLEDLRMLGASTMAHDIYLWLTYRMHQLEKPQRISYEQLHEQFGTNYGQMRDFRLAFRKHLARVLSVYEDANVSVDPDKSFVTLHPSKPRVPAKRITRG